MTRSRMDSWIRELEGLPVLTREALERLQLKKLNDLLKREKERGGFYRNLPSELPSLGALAELPFTEASDLAGEAGRLLLTSQADVARIITGQTSGTAGPSKRLFYTERDLAHTVGLFEVGIGEMAGPGDGVLIAMPFSGPFGLGDLIEKAVIGVGAKPLRSVAYSGEAAGRFGGVTDRADTPCERGSLGARADQIRREAPSCVIGFPVPILGVARYYEALYGRGAFPIKKALISGDACPEGVTRALEALGLELYPHYGSREMALGGAVTCPAHRGMHLRENHVLAEIVGEDGRPLPDGEWGELVITTLDMEAMPLIRYRTGDRTRFFKEPCPCGGVTRRLDRVSRIPGRGTAETADPAGPESASGAESLSMEAIDDALFPLPGVIDVKAKRAGEKVLVTVRAAAGFDRDSAEAALERGFPKTEIALETEAAGPNDRLFYAGKRVVG